MSSRLVFRESNHTYTLDQYRIPGVTTAIGKAHDKPGLVGAAAKATAEWCAANVDTLADLGPEVWAKAATASYRDAWAASGRRGTLLHDAARQLIAGDPLTPVDAEGMAWPDDVIRTAEQLARFMDEWDVDPVLTERPVFHEVDGWAGTIDLVADMDGDRWLLDYKTGRTGIYPKDALQLAAYRHATHVQAVDETTGELVDRPMPKVRKAACVWVRPDFYEVVPVRSDDALYRVFLSMLPVASWMGWKPTETVGRAATECVAS